MPTLFDLHGIDLNEEAPQQPEKAGFLRRAVGDTGISLVKGAIGVPEAIVGVADLATGGQAGRLAEQAGFRPKEARTALDELLSPQQQAANREVQQASGFMETARAMLSNPSTIYHAAVESAPSLLPAGVVARGAMAGAQRLSPTLAGRIAAAEAAPLVASRGAKTAAELTRLAATGIGEGVVSAGQTAEQVRQETADGLLTGEQSAIAGASGALTGIIGGVAGKIANKLGIGDVNQLVAGVQQAGPAAQKSFVRAMLEGFATEGVLQELPQSAQEQIAQNVALGKPWDEGVGAAAASGALAGGFMGGVAGPMHRSPSHADPVTESLDKLAKAGTVSEMIKAAQEVVGSPTMPAGFDATRENMAMTAMERQMADDASAMRFSGGRERAQPAPITRRAPQAQASATIVPDAPMLDRLATVQESLRDARVRDQVRQQFGEDGLNTLLYYADVANRPGGADGIPDVTRERMLGLAEALISRATLQPVAQPGAVGAAPQAQQLEAPVQVPRIGLDTTPTGRMRADATGNVAPETRADAISTAQRVNARDERLRGGPGMEAQTPRDLPQRLAEQADPVTAYVERQRTVDTPEARQFVRDFNAGKITRRDVIRVMQEQGADPLAGKVYRTRSAASAEARKSGKVVESEPAAKVEGGGVANPTKESRGPAASEAWKNEGKSAADLMAERVDALGKEFAGTLAGAVREEDFDAKEVPTGVKMWAEEQKIPADDLRAAVLKHISGFDIPTRASKQIRAALNPTNPPTQAQAGTLAEGAGGSRPMPGQAQQGERTYDQLVDQELAQTKQRYAEAGKQIGLSFEQFMRDVEDGKRSGHSIAEAQRDLPKTREDLEAVKAGRKAPRSIVGVGGTKAQAVKWLESQIKRLEDRIATGGQSEPTNRSNYNRALRDALDGKEQAPSKTVAPAPEAVSTPAKKLPFVSKEEGARLFGKPKPTDQVAILPLDQAANEAATSPSNDLPEPTDAQKEGLTASGRYRDGGEWSAEYEPVQRNDGQWMLVRKLSDSDGQRTEYLDADGSWVKGTPSRIAVSGVGQIGGADVFPSRQHAVNAAQSQHETSSFKPGKVFQSVTGEKTADELKARLPEMEKAKPVSPVVDEPAGFDSAAWDKARNDRIEASRAAGNVHLDEVPAYVETMRGKNIFYVHDTKVRGTIRTVDTRGNVYVNWADAYSAEKEMAQPVRDGKKVVMQSSIGPRDLKDYALATEKAKPVEAREEVTRSNQPLSDREQREAKAKAQADLDAALGDLGDIFGKNTRLGIMPEQEQKLLPVLTRVLDAAFRLGYYKFKDAARFALQTIRAKLGDDVADQLTLDHLQGAYIGMAGKYQEQGADTKRAVIEVESLAELEPQKTPPVASTPEAADTEPQEKPENDPAPAASSPALDSPLADGLFGDGQDAPARGNRAASRGPGRADGGSVRRRSRRGPAEGSQQLELGNAGGDGAAAPARTRNLAEHRRGLPADYRPAAGGLTREGSWHATAARNLDLIDLARRIEAEGRAATPGEQEQLSKYVGFGAGEIRNNLFPVPPEWAKREEPQRLIWPKYVREDRWRALAERAEKLPVEWQRSMLQSSQYAHYTSENIVRAMWSGMERMGFTGGKVLEPGMGIGNFAMLMPESVRGSSVYTGVEFDGPTALIARLLSPQQNMLHDDFIKRKLPREFFDLAIGNPPFSQTKVQADPDYEKHGFMLHDFFFAKSIDRVRPGGLLAFVTSKGTMDKQSDKARAYLAARADLLGAIRLPSTAFEGNAGTSVVTDVIFLRKRAAGEAAGGKAWTQLKTVETKDGPVAVNEYFAEHPEMILGQQRISGNVDDEGRRINSNGRGGEKYTVVSYDKTPGELDAKFAAAMDRLPANVYSALQQDAQQVKQQTASLDFDPKIRREGVVYLADDGRLMRVTQGVGKPLADEAKLTAKDEVWLRDYVGLRELVQEARAAQFNDGDWKPALEKLNAAYDKFRATHGPVLDYRTITRKTTDEDGNIVESTTRVLKNRRLFREDYDAAIVTAMESIDEAGDIQKARFLRERTIGKPTTPEVKTVGDALAVSLDGLGRLNLDDVARRVNLSREEVVDALGASIYEAPGGEWQLADEYLSGDVVTKLEEAEAAARIDPALKRNVDALKAVQPEKLGPSHISVKLGASWVPAKYLTEFANEIEAGAVTFDPKTESWQVEGGNERKQRRAGAEYGTAARSASELLEAALNSRTVTIKVKDENKKEVTDAEATAAANEAIRKIKDKFKSWVWTDSERAGDLVELYNRRFNNLAPRRFDGSHLTLPGLRSGFKPHPHQLRAIWRQIQTGNTYLAHAVGAGKTFEMIAGGMEQKRLGLIKKPMYVVPNHMLEQFANEFMEFYPLANVMVADDENFSAERRKAFVAAATLNAPDAIVITHSAFERVGVKEETVAPIRDEILTDLEMELSSVAEDRGERVRRSQLEQQIEAVTQRFDRIVSAGGKDSTIKFEDIGADFLYVDEAHAYRKLDFSTNQKIKGIDPNGSKRALDMYVKTQWLGRQQPGRSHVFASGTPVTNTMGELYTLMRFYADDELHRAGMATFDSWARAFGEVVPALEANAAGRYEVVERFAKFDNVPELMSRVRMFMDVLTSEHLGALVKRPDIEGGKPDLITVDASAALKSYMKTELLPRLERSRKWKPSKDEPFNPDPVIAITSDGRFAALDPRFFGGELDDGETTKLNRMADEIAAEYKASAGNTYVDKAGKPMPTKGGTQVVFYNLGFGAQSQKNRGFSARNALTTRLTAAGVKREHIAWFDDADTDAKKESVFKAMRQGQVRILIGSAKKMGTGVNVQNRLTALHYFDPPWYPSDVEQPHGRILRQGNQNEIARIKWYATKGTYDSTMWQMVARKQRFIDQAFSGDKSVRSMDDMSEASVFEQAAAMASGDPRAMQLAGLRQDVERLERLQAAHHSEQIKVGSALRSAQWNAEHQAERQARYAQAFKAIGESYVGFQQGSIGGTAFQKAGEFGEALKGAFNRVAAEGKLESEIGTLNGKLVTLRTDAVINSKTKEQTGEHILTAIAGGVEFEIATGSSMGADVSGQGLTSRIVNAVNSIERSMREAKAAQQREMDDATRLRKKLGAPFEHEQELLSKHAELKELEAQLRAEGEAAAAEPPKAVGAINEDGEDSGDRPAVAFSRSSKLPNGLPHSLVQKYAKQYEAAGLHRVNVARNIGDLPARLQAKMSGAGDDVRGAYFRAEDQVWLFSDRLNSMDELHFVVIHEAFHRGLWHLFGEDGRKIMRQMYATNKALRDRADMVAKELKIDRDEAIEEALADMAGEGGVESLRGWKGLVQLIRKWLLGLATRLGVPLRFSDAQIRAFVAGVAGAGLRAQKAEPVLLTRERDMVMASREGQRDQTDTPEFKRWFGDSKVVDAEGKPLVVYHGTPFDFDVFGGKPVDYVRGFFFSDKPGGTPAAMGPGTQIMPVYLSLKNPRVVSSDVLGDIQLEYEELKRAKQFGYDGLMGETEAGETIYVAFRPEQIKSAIGNSGAFDGSNPDIRFSRSSPLSSINQQAIRDKVSDLFSNAGEKVSWWDKTIGTQYNKAKKHPAFKRVFDHVQQYVEDTSTLANEAADKAPAILPKLESVRDVFAAHARGLSTEDKVAVAAPIFEGTLDWARIGGKLVRIDDAARSAEQMSTAQKARRLVDDGRVSQEEVDRWENSALPIYEGAIRNRYEQAYLTPGVVFNRQELRDLFKLNERQIEQYEQFRSAVNESLDQVATADALRLLGESPAELRAMAMGDRAAFRAGLVDYMEERIAEEEDTDVREQLRQTMADIEDKFNRVDDMKARGYAPLMRFGKFLVSVKGAEGEQEWFSLHETKAEANKMARELQGDPQFRGRVRQGVLSEEAYKLFSSIPVESLEMFAGALGAEKSAVFQEYLRMTKNNRSALKRLIQRKGTAGFSDEVSRVLASFVASNARLAAGAMNMPAAKEAADEIRDGDLKDEGVKLIETVQNPTDTAGVLRGLMFTHFIGGSIASALVNVTQPVMMTLPWLSQWGGGVKAASRLMASARMAAGGKIADTELAKALERAEKDGIVSPQEIHHLTAEAMATWGKNPWLKRVAFIWSAPFSVAEQFNRRVTFLAAYKTAKEEGIADPFAFAQEAVVETQGLYNKGNSANWTRNPIGATALTFKQYSVHYLEWIKRMWNAGEPGSRERTEGRRAVLLAMALLFAAGGAEGLPFAEDLDDLADTIMQALGFDTSAKGWKREFIAKTLGLGDEGADVLMRGLSAVPGIPLDVSMRMGMGNLLPGTGMLLKSTTDASRDIAELAGPAGSLLTQWKDAGKKALDGDIPGAMLGAMPGAIQNMGKAASMWMNGEARDTKGRRIMQTDEIDGFMRFLGFNPSEIARESARLSEQDRRVRLTRAVESSIADQWAQGMRDGNADAVQEARAQLQEWNDTNPESRISINSAQIKRRLKDLGEDRSARFERAAPRELRGSVHGALN